MSNPLHQHHKTGCMFDESQHKIQPKQHQSPSKSSSSVDDTKRKSSSNKKDQKNKPKVKSPANEEKSSEISVKNENYDGRNHLNLVMIGHVDHGKSTIAGQILLQTGQIDERMIAKYKRKATDKGRDSWWLAYLLDQDEDEQNKGKTVECGKAYFETLTKRYTIIDAPGHLNYVPNMIIGATQADVALLVVSARTNEFEQGFQRGGQTREHGLIALTLGISRVIVIVNKMDTVKWDEERYLFIKERIYKFLSKDIGFKKKHISFIPISGQKGLNISGDAIDAKICKWYKGGTLLDLLDNVKAVKRAIDKPLRIPIVDKFKTDGELQAVGMIQHGVIKKGQIVKIMPSEHVTKICGLQIDDEKQEKVEMVRAGENVIITFDKNDKLIMNRKDLLQSGSVICDKENATEVVEEFVAEIYVHEIPDGLILTKGFQAMMHSHNLCVLCEIAAIKKSQKIKRPFLREHDRAMVKIKLMEKCSLETFDECRVLGRFILRDRSKTVMIGKIREVIPSQSRLRNGSGKRNKHKINDNDEQKSEKN